MADNASVKHLCSSLYKKGSNKKLICRGTLNYFMQEDGTDDNIQHDSSGGSVFEEAMCNAGRLTIQEAHSWRLKSQLKNLKKRI